MQTSPQKAYRPAAYVSGWEHFLYQSWWNDGRELPWSFNFSDTVKKSILEVSEFAFFLLTNRIAKVSNKKYYEKV